MKKHTALMLIVVAALLILAGISSEGGRFNRWVAALHGR